MALSNCEISSDDCIENGKVDVVHVDLLREEALWHERPCSTHQRKPVVASSVRHHETPEDSIDMCLFASVWIGTSVSAIKCTATAALRPYDALIVREGIWSAGVLLICVLHAAINAFTWYSRASRLTPGRYASV